MALALAPVTKTRRGDDRAGKRIAVYAAIAPAARRLKACEPFLPFTFVFAKNVFGGNQPPSSRRSAVGSTRCRLQEIARPHAALSEILGVARFDAPGSPIIGADPVVPTRYKICTAGAASLAAPARVSQVRQRGGGAASAVVDCGSRARRRAARATSRSTASRSRCGDRKRLLPGARLLDQHPRKCAAPRRRDARIAERGGSEKAEKRAPPGWRGARGRDPRRRRPRRLCAARERRRTRRRAR